MADLLESAKKEFGGPVNTVINCAGVAPAVKTWHPKKGPHPLEVFEKTLQINAIGMTHLRARICVCVRVCACVCASV